MASFKKLPSGLWQAQVFRRGVRASLTFASKGAATVWAGTLEAQILAGTYRTIADHTFADLLDRYQREVSAQKKGKRWEEVRIGLLKRDQLAQARLKHLSPAHVASWRDRRLQAVSGPSVRREWNLLSHACNIALKEWGWLQVNPFKEVRRPKSNQARDRTFTNGELEKLKEKATTPMRQEAYRAVLFAIETGMRASEICSSPPINGRVLRLEDTKNGTRRDVPLSAAALELYGAGFSITPGTLDATFRAMRDEAGIEGLHFHDTRHTACTRLSVRLNMLQLQKMLGIKDPRVLSVYYNERAEDIAKLL